VDDTRTISNSPTITPVPKNYGHPCAVSWVDWLESRLSYSLRTSRSKIVRDNFWTGNYEVSARVETLATPSTVISTIPITTSMPTQCDHIPRVSVIDTVTLTEIQTLTTIRDGIYIGNSSFKTVFDSEDTLPLDFNDAYYNEPTPKAPTCKTPEDQCALAWESLKTALKRYVPQAQQLWDWSVAHPDPTIAAEVMDAAKRANATKNSVTGNTVIDVFLQWDLGPEFLGGCIQPRIELMSRCWNVFEETRPELNTQGLTPEEVLTKVGEETGCLLKPDHGVLLYFPPKKAKTTRDICANSGWGDDPLPAATNEPPETAIVTEVVFSAHSFFKTDQTISPSFWEKYPKWKTKSTMKGRWTMTAGSAYLAINTLKVHYPCQWRTPILDSDIMLSFHTSDLRSLVTNMTAATSPIALTDLLMTRSFNLLDLQGPVPVNPWQMSLGSPDPALTITDGSYEPLIPLPAALAAYNPIYKSCVPFYLPPRVTMYGVDKYAYVWDPPITLTGTRATIPTQTSEPQPSPPSLSNLAPMTSMPPSSTIISQSSQNTGTGKDISGAIRLLPCWQSFLAFLSAWFIYIFWGHL
jgi:hypothetical protein